jgi:VanZ family protein
MAHAIPGNQLLLPSWDMLAFDKLGHVFLFAMFSFSWINGFYKQSYSYKLKVYGPKVLVVVSLILGLVLEAMQQAIFVERYFEWPDWIADGMGSFAGVVVFYSLYGKVLKYTS